MYSTDRPSDYWLTAKVCACQGGKGQIIHAYCISILWLRWMVTFQELVGCHDIHILGKSPFNWRQRPGMTLAIYWDVKHQFKQKYN